MTGAALGSVAMTLLLLGWTAGLITYFTVRALSLHSLTSSSI